VTDAHRGSDPDRAAAAGQGGGADGEHRSALDGGEHGGGDRSGAERSGGEGGDRGRERGRRRRRDRGDGNRSPSDAKGGSGDANRSGTSGENRGIGGGGVDGARSASGDDDAGSRRADGDDSRDVAGDGSVRTDGDAGGGENRDRAPGDRGRGGRERGGGRGADRGGGDRSGAGGDRGGGDRSAGGGRGGDRSGGGDRSAGGGRGGDRSGGSDRSGGRGGRDRGERPRDGREGLQAAAVAAAAASTAGAGQNTGTMPRLEQQRRPAQHDDDDLPTDTPAVAWGTDDGAPAPQVTLAADLPPDPPADDEDPASHVVLDAPIAALGEVVSATAVRFVPNGRISWFDAGESDWAVGERVIVDSDRGQRVGWVAIAPSRKAMGNRERLRRVIRRANDADLKGEREGEADRAKALRVAKDHAARLRLQIKVFRVEVSGPLGKSAKVLLYYSALGDDRQRFDFRELMRDTTNDLGGARLELRQLGVRDEAKAVGGIGSCGLTLCCTTWLPDFVPVSIKMAKDQGLVLSPTKVSGQCGRLKCCLVYEQAAYAELRKGLPKLGKRVIGVRGEGRVVEVDVLRQRVRVSYGPGDSEVVPATEVQPLFPSGNPPPRERGERDARGPRPGVAPVPEVDDDDEPESAADQTDDPSALANVDPRANLGGGATDRPEDSPPPEEPADDDHDDLDDLDVPDLPDEDPSRDPNAED
jgi:cell fate regulator YaaT (PSP1 superfamily)